MWYYALLLFHGVVFGDSIRNSTGEYRLSRDILLNNIPYERPRYNKSENVTVEVDFHLRSVNHFDEAQQQLVCTGWFKMTWFDEFLTWDPKLYNGTDFIRPPNSYVWTPDIVASNSFQQVDALGGDFVSLKLNSSGHVEWMPGDLFSIPCDVNIQHYPFDSLVCNLELLVWGHTDSEVDLISTTKSAGIAQFKRSGQWSLLSTSVIPDPIEMGNQTAARVFIKMQLDRTPTNFVFSFIMPVLILSLLGTFVFLIPSDSGEKISFAITIPLSYGVYMGFLTTMVPQTAQGISVFVIFLGLTLVFSAIFVILSIFSVRISNLKESSTLIPRGLHKLTLWVEGVKTCGRRKQITDLGNLDDSNPSEAAKYTCEPISWKRVSKALDLLFFWIFFLPIMLSIPSLLLYVLVG